jgi:hypothetical protein
MTATPPSEHSPWSTLRRFARPRGAVERCNLCGAELGAVHSHLLEPATRQLRCSCEPCAILFSGRQDGRFRRVEPRAERLDGFSLSDARWDDLHLPINLAFFIASSETGKVHVYYPSPAGATESLLTLAAWDDLVADNPILKELAPDIDALLVNRLGSARNHYRVSIDECYALVGLIRTHWRGLWGGAAVWNEIGRFFNNLNERSRPPGVAPCPT